MDMELNFFVPMYEMCTDIIITFIAGKNDLSGESLNFVFTWDLVAPILPFQTSEVENYYWVC